MGKYSEALSNLHQIVDADPSPEWTKFRNKFPNPSPKQIYEKAKEIDKLIEDHKRIRGF